MVVPSQALQRRLAKFAKRPQTSSDPDGYAVNLWPVFLQYKPVEPPVRQRYFILLSMFASLPAMALTFQTRLENIEWKVEGDKFECRLIQPITDFGSGAFVRRAGEQAVFRLNAYNSMLSEGSAKLLAAAAPGNRAVGILTWVRCVLAVDKCFSTAPKPRPPICFEA